MTLHLLKQNLEIKKQVAHHLHDRGNHVKGVHSEIMHQQKRFCEFEKAEKRVEMLLKKRVFSSIEPLKSLPVDTQKELFVFQ